MRIHEDTLDQLTDELVERFKLHGQAAVRRCVERAIVDLRGSVHNDALPEMAIRLAGYRLDLDEARAADRAS